MEMTKGMHLVIGKAILGLKMTSNDAGADTIGDYLRSLLRGIWIEEEGFDGKRPFGNSGWHQEIYETLVKERFLDGDSDHLPYDDTQAEELVLLAIDAM
jgi:hypothetical protein